MKRRGFIVAGGALLATAASGARSQASKPRRIAFLLPGRESGGFGPMVQTFRAALEKLGHVAGRDVVLEHHWAEDRTQALDSLAREVVAGRPDVIVTATSAAVAACKSATTSIPVVFATAVNPVEQRFVLSLQRPGGNITGVLVYGDLTQKLVEVAREAFPAAKRFALLVHDADPVHRFALKGYAASTERLKLEPLIVRVARVEDFDRAFSELAGQKADVLILPQQALTTSQHAPLIERALKARLPLVSGQIFIAEKGGLLSYGARIEENYERAAVIVDKILRGANPAEIPVEQPQRFELVVNRRTARAIGVTLSPVTMLRADRIIE